MEELEGKVAVVTGAASGIGLALSRRFGREGMRLVVADVEAGALETAAAELADGTEVLAVVADVSDLGAVDELARQAFERFGTVHVVCNNAGVGGLGDATWEGTREAWEWVLGVNLWGVINGVRAFTPRLVEQDEGHIVNTASISGLAALPHMGAYTASKHAVLGLSECLFHELALRGSTVGVSVLCPGFLKTGIFESDRNWPTRFGDAPQRPDDESAQAMWQLGQALIAAAPEPTDLADAVVDAIKNRRFMVLTDEALAQAAVQGRQAVVDGGSPTLPVG